MARRTFCATSLAITIAPNFALPKHSKPPTNASSEVAQGTTHVRISTTTARHQYSFFEMTYVRQKVCTPLKTLSKRLSRITSAIQTHRSGMSALELSHGS
ncbi:hypothetical protein PF008_g29944 [Phytophthora fragariae]|uniref:Uncharacterized protein n=1 Tax=Phytophthora fragariae TaxID=53985 RepID=A0A6G0Q7G5_9STRA|nr:hypothetical protein PF008_g29944 [Phytophthora fragariae]